MVKRYFPHKIWLGLIVALWGNFAFANSVYDDQFFKSAQFTLQNMHHPNASPGAIIAAPSREHPDYFYHWVRDAALTLEAAIDLYESNALKSTKQKKLRDFFIDHIAFNKTIHRSSLNAEGLGEPKFAVDGSVYAFPWGRPQNDGPALRATSLARVLEIATKENWPQLNEVRAALYEAKLPTKSLIKADLEFVAHRWPDLNFDLWEEVYGTHFYTMMAQRKALFIGAKLATQFKDFGAAQFYESQFHRVNQELEKFWSPNQGFILATLNSNSPKSHLDSAVILAVLHSHLPGYSFSLTDDRVIATFQKLKSTFNTIYSVNKNPNYGVAFGRYPEDTYDGYNTDKLGNPWVLTTAGAAEYLYRLSLEIEESNKISISRLNQKFFNEVGRYHTFRVNQTLSGETTQFSNLVQQLVYDGDNYLDRVIFHRNPDGSLSEQINRFSGYMQGAPNLTWSHASFVTAKLAREKIKSKLQKLKGHK